MILLTVPHQTGDFDPNGPYTHIKINSFSLDSVNKNITIKTAYGYINGSGVFTPGIKHGPYIFVSDSPNATPPTSDYTDLIIQAPQTGELIYSAASRVLYQYLLSKGYYSGTLV